MLLFHSKDFVKEHSIPFNDFIRKYYGSIHVPFATTMLLYFNIEIKLSTNGCCMTKYTFSHCVYIYKMLLGSLIFF